MDSGDGVHRRGRIVVDGLLAPFADGLRSELAGQGYAPDTIVDHVHLLADLSGWLSGHGLTAAELTSEVAWEFLRARRAAGHRTGVSDRALAPTLGYLRRLAVVPPSTVVAPITPMELLLAEYRRYLEDERGLAAGTVVHYLRYARLFLTWLPGSVERSLPQLSAGQVIGFVRDWTKRRQSTALDMVVLPALRSLLRFVHVAGHVTVALGGAVPAGRGRPRNNDRPRAARRDDVRAVLAGCDRNSAVGRRDYAILLMLARLAVRGGEVARLELTDVNWRAAELTVRGKGGRADVLPLPADVGAAMADYLLHARSASASRTLFVTVKAPFTGLANSSVTVLVAAACARVGVSRFGPHGVRHAAACDLLAAGASMEEIGQLLRHARQRTTAIYDWIRPDSPSWRCLARREPPDEHAIPRRAVPGDAPRLGVQAAGRGPDAAGVR